MCPASAREEILKDVLKLAYPQYRYIPNPFDVNANIVVDQNVAHPHMRFHSICGNCWREAAETCLAASPMTSMFLITAF